MRHLISDNSSSILVSSVKKQHHYYCSKSNSNTVGGKHRAVHRNPEINTQQIQL